MRKFVTVLAAVLCAAPFTVHAQGAASASVPLAHLPDPGVPEDAAPSAFVTAARNAIAAGRTGAAMEAIERAESRLLVRSVRPSRAWVPSDQALVRMLADARAALGQGDRATALARLAEAQANPALDAAEE